MVHDRTTGQRSWYACPNRRLVLVIGAPVFAQLLGSAFNIWYNFIYIQPLLSPEQMVIFLRTVLVFNLVVYPVGIGLWVGCVLALKHPLQKVWQQQAIAPEQLLQARQRVINLPWWGMAISGALWFLCIPVFLLTLSLAPGTLNWRLFWDLPISFTIAALIAISHSFFAIELVTQTLLYPLLFQDIQPFQVPGTFPLSLRFRVLFLAFCSSICPIASLLLLILAPHAFNMQDIWFAIAVGGVGIGFSLLSSYLFGQQVIVPIRELQTVTAAVTNGNFNHRIKALRADEFGPLITEVNTMIRDLEEKQILQETFGRHVGHRAARQILQRDPHLGGIDQELTVLFADLRNFTHRSALQSPQQTVKLLNLFFSEMVEIIERYDGMVNKFLGDGLMALFGVGEVSDRHATQAVGAGLEMLDRLGSINQLLRSQSQEPLAMGIGIHTGRAIVGSIGSSQRLEYTAIGDTVNVASRVESLTKTVGEPLLITLNTQKALANLFLTEPLPPQLVKGKTKPLHIFRVIGGGDSSLSQALRS